MNTLITPAKGLSDHYKGTPAEAVLTRTQNMKGIKLGNTEKAAERILEIVTCTGMAESEDVKGCLRVILGADCLKSARDDWKAFGKNLDIMEEIAMSTGLED